MAEPNGAARAPSPASNLIPPSTQYLRGRFSVQDFDPVAPRVIETEQHYAHPSLMVYAPKIDPALVYVHPAQPVLEGLDKIKASNVQHQKALRDLIIFHRPGEAVLGTDTALDRVVSFHLRRAYSFRFCHSPSPGCRFLTIPLNLHFFASATAFVLIHTPYYGCYYSFRPSLFLVVTL